MIADGSYHSRRQLASACSEIIEDLLKEAYVEENPFERFSEEPCAIKPSLTETFRSLTTVPSAIDASVQTLRTAAPSSAASLQEFFSNRNYSMSTLAESSVSSSIIGDSVEFLQESCQDILFQRKVPQKQSEMIRFDSHHKRAMAANFSLYAKFTAAAVTFNILLIIKYIMFDVILPWIVDNDEIYY